MKIESSKEFGIAKTVPLSLRPACPDIFYSRFDVIAALPPIIYNEYQPLAPLTPASISRRCPAARHTS